MSRRFLPALLALLLAACQPQADTQSNDTRLQYALAIHGGAGVIRREDLSAAEDAQYRQSLNAALDLGRQLLEQGRPALEVVEAVVQVLEDDSLFNAGRGAVMTAAGSIELDASIMDGASGKAGAVAGIKRLRHPISAARAVMAQSPHVMMAGRGAELFAQQTGLEVVDTAYFRTQRRWQQLQEAQSREKLSAARQNWEALKYGTVGAVALDRSGNLAAATSTGGMTNKRWGRIGDSPIIGAGTYADNNTCAVSCTGHGEFFIRNVVAYDVAARMAYAGESLDKAANEVVMNKLRQKGGEGGLIAVDAKGNVSMPFNSEGMFRGFVNSKGEQKVMIYRE